MVELGNDKPTGPKVEDEITAQDIADAYDQCEAGKGVKIEKNLPDGWRD